MSAAIFPFKLRRRGFREYLSMGTVVETFGAGRQVAQKVKPGGSLEVAGSILFPNPGGLWTDFVEFWEARNGPYDPFLYRRQDPGYGSMLDTPEIDSGAQTLFGASRRYVATASLVVRLDGNAKVLGVDYTVENESGGAYVLGTSTSLQVRFAVAPGLGHVVEFEYDFYYPVRFVGDDLPEEQELVTGGISGTKVADRTLQVRLRETGPGYSLANAPTAL